MQLRKVTNDVVGEDNSGPLALGNVRVDRAVRRSLDHTMSRHLNRFEVRILELLREGQVENPTSTIVFKPLSTKQRTACRLLRERKMVNPIGTLNKTNAEVKLAAKGMHYLTRRVKSGT